MIAAVRRNSVFDHGVMGMSLTGYSMPIFWWGLLLILLFSVQLGWTPVSGRIAVKYYIEPVTGFLTIDALLSGEKGAFKSAVSHLILPTIVLGTQPLAIIARMTRSAMLEVLGEDYIRTARAKGLSQLRVIALHAFRNALIPVITVIGLQVGVLFTGAILTETIFSWPGVGKWLIEAINRRDYPGAAGRPADARPRRDDRQPAGRRRLRRHQSAHPALDLSMATPLPCRGQSPPRRRRGPLREFWGYFSANHGAVAGPRRRHRRAADGGVRQRARALSAGPHQQRSLPASRRRGRPAARLGVSARHRRDRPRHPVAPHLRRAAVAADRHRGGRAVDRRRHRRSA